MILGHAEFLKFPYFLMRKGYMDPIDVSLNVIHRNKVKDRSTSTTKKHKNLKNSNFRNSRHL